ncbi:MAG TPA: phosphatidylserine/phosphatidylglycerophosphate/cardiolipin synthase family protein [Solirubrobacteraceae bacterium]|nr:phosphatidylserine/phosphatidylglycerophosphate/cardiolipin synthase family protein [Solirubrobacteraceae bacterium]
MDLEPVSRIDRLTGSMLERSMDAHHRRRLKRAGRLGQLSPPDDGSLWAAGEPAPREGNALEILIDGAQALPRIAEAIAGARQHVHIAGWHVTADFGLTRDASASPLRDLLGELAERVDVRVLLWGGSPLPVFTPDRAAVRRVRDELMRGTRVRCALDTHERPMHCHHEKLVIVDGQVAFVGGIDITSLGGDRYDTSDHPMRSRLGWHDAASRIAGPAVADVAQHFAARWRETTGESIETGQAPATSGDVALQVVRTVPEKVYEAFPHGDFRILESYTRALRSARKLVYLESQFLWSAQVVEILAAKLRRPPADDFRVVVLLPAKPNNGADSTRGQLAQLVRADDGAERFLATTISARTGRLSGPMYVHAKIAIVDDRWLTLGSANLNEHSLFNDTEMNIVTCDVNVARQTRLRLWSEHLERPTDEISGDPTDVIDGLWRPVATEQRDRLRRGDSLTHRLRELPGVSRRSMALLGPLDSLVVDG